MRTSSGRVRAISLDPLGQPTAWVSCPLSAIPAPGQYTLAQGKNEAALLATPLFASESDDHGFLAAAPLPPSWIPGTELWLRGPLGSGFRLPREIHRLALGALGDTAMRLLPLVKAVTTQQADIALFTDAPLPSLPVSIEAHPLASLPEALSWADFIALDAPLQMLSRLYEWLERCGHISCPAQVLIYTPMPCAGAAACGVCAIPVRRGWKLACEDGPVFNLAELAG